MRIKNCKIEVIKGEVTKAKVEAIVDLTNNRLIMDKGVRRVIKMDFKSDEKKIRFACENALKTAERLRVKSIAFLKMDCGEGRFPYGKVGKIMTEAILKHLMERDSRIGRIVFCLSEEGVYNIFKKVVKETVENIERKVKNSPLVTVDAIIEINGGIVLVKRKNPPFGWALPGGFVEYGESLEEAVLREAEEETGLKLGKIVQFHTYSDPKRDPRFHTISTVFIAKAKGVPKADTDVSEVRIFNPTELKNIDFVFDHKEIIQDYLKYKKISC